MSLLLISKLFRFYSAKACGIMKFANAPYDIEQCKERNKQNSILLSSSSLIHTLCSIISKRAAIILLVVGSLFIYKICISIYQQTNAPIISKLFTLSTLSLTSAEPTIIIITPTYKRMERMPDMIRLSQTLMHIENVHWIVVENGNTTADVVDRLLRRSHIPYVYFSVPTAPGFSGRFEFPWEC